MNVIPLNQNPTLSDSLATLDKLREDVAAGRIIAFAAVGIDQEDRALAYVGSSKPVSKLKLQGAVSKLNNAALTGEV